MFNLFKQNTIIAHDKIQKQREIICLNCSYRQQLIHGIGRCTECGCIIESKIIFKSSECPLKKWGAVK